MPMGIMKRSRHRIDFEIYKFGEYSGYQCICGKIINLGESHFSRNKCPHPKCTRNIASGQFCCGLHWRHIPNDIRSLIFENGPGVISDRGRVAAIQFWDKKSE